MNHFSVDTRVFGNRNAADNLKASGTVQNTYLNEVENSASNSGTHIDLALSGMNTLAKALDAFVVKGHTDFSDAFAEKSICLINENIETVIRNNEADEAKQKIMIAESIAEIAYSQTGGGLCGSMSDVISRKFGLSHDLCSAMIVPLVVTFNAGLKRSEETKTLNRYAELALCWDIDATDAKKAVSMMVNRIRELGRKIGVPGRFEKLGIHKAIYVNAIDNMTFHVMNDCRTSMNPEKVTSEDIKRLFLQLLFTV